jgi:hypothetical protein
MECSNFNKIILKHNIDLTYTEDLENPVTITYEKDKISFGDANFKNIEENIKIMYNYAINKQLCAFTNMFKIFNSAINIIFNLEYDISKLNIQIRGENNIDFEIFISYFVFIGMDEKYSIFIKKIIRKNYDKEDNKEKYLKELLRFVTGSTGIPVGGYVAEPKEINGPPTFSLENYGMTIFAHTCFNYVDIREDALEELILLENNEEELTKNYLYTCFTLEKLIENSSNFSMAGGSKARVLSLKMMSKNNMTKLFGSAKKYKIIKIKNNK